MKISASMRYSIHVAWLKFLFGADSRSSSFGRRRVSIRNPLIIHDPKIGFLNLLGSQARLLVGEDSQALKPLFSDYLESDTTIPICDVLMMYARIDSSGAIQNATNCLREIIYESHAPVVIIATENSAPSYVAASKSGGRGRANLVMTLQRKAGSFPIFFKELFTMMYQGTTMPMAWVKLVPQIPGAKHENVPGTVCAMEISHILFKRDIDTMQ